MTQQIKNATIESVSISSEDHGVLSAWVQLDYGGSGQGFGGYTLYCPNKLSIKGVAGHFIFRVMEVAGVANWDEVAGKTLRVKGGHTGIDAIGHITKDDWFCPKQDFSDEETT